MLSGKVGEPGSEGELSLKTAAGCAYLCGMCPTCLFAPTPPGSTQTPWVVSNQFKRGFVLSLILRCEDVQLLQSIQSLVEVTSWPLFTYARSRGPTLPSDFPPRGSRWPLNVKPQGVDTTEIWNWFNASPAWIKSRYLCRIFSLCDAEILRMVSNLTGVLLVRLKRGFLQSNASHYNRNQCDLDSDDPELMVVPGSSRSVSGVGRYRDFVGCLPIHLAKRILGLLGEKSLEICTKVCQYWKQLAQETKEDMKLRKVFQNEINNMMKSSRTISPTYANLVGVLVPLMSDDIKEIHSNQKVLPFEAAYAGMKTKVVQMEERNVYCGAYFTKVLLSKDDSQRVLDYRGSVMVASSRDRALNVFHVGSEVRSVGVMKGHSGPVRAVLLCEERGLVITASADVSIRCWSLKTDKCEMMLYGHTGTISCLDLHGDRLVSGARDCSVKLWSLTTGKQVEGLNWKHLGAVLCVKITKTTVYSSCDKGRVKVWRLADGTLLTVIDAHKNPVKYLCLDRWHLLSGDSGGKVKAWSINYKAKKCLMTFRHPREVKSMSLLYLRVITGCVDGQIRIFNFLTGTCLKNISGDTETSNILSLHFLEDSIVVNTVSKVKVLQFSKVFWNYACSAEGGQGDKEVSARKLLLRADSRRASRKIKGSIGGTPGGGDLLHQIQHLSDPTFRRPRVRFDTTTHTAMLSERAASQRMKKRGLHHPPTRDLLVFRTSAMERAQRTDDVSVNTEANARLRDSWGPRAPPLPVRAKTCIPILQQNQTKSSQISPGGFHRSGAGKGRWNVSSGHPAMILPRIQAADALRQRRHVRLLMQMPKRSSRGTLALGGTSKVTQ